VSRPGFQERELPEAHPVGKDRTLLLATSSPDADLARQALEAAPTVVYVYDLQKDRHVFQNRRFGELLGHPAREKGANEWTLHIHPDDARHFEEHREKLKSIRQGETSSFEFRMRDVDGGWRWFVSRDTLMAPHLVVGSAFDITEQKRAEQHKELLADEMRHRARNFVSLVQAIGRMSRPKNQPEVNRYLDKFVGRILTLLNTGGIVLSSSTRTADLRTVIEATLAPFSSEHARIQVSGPEVSLSEQTAGGLALAFHELATNAIKYGALSLDTGSIAVEWRVADGRQFVMEWKERGGPPVERPASEGFGGMVIRQSVARERGGKIMLDYAPAGLTCRFEFEIGA
jgi:PAS domain S-box-containing protein